MENFSQYASLLSMPSNIVNFYSAFATATDDSYTTLLTPKFLLEANSWASAQGLSDVLTDITDYTATEEEDASPTSGSSSASAEDESTTATGGANTKVLSLGSLAGVAALLLL